MKIKVFVLCMAAAASACSTTKQAIYLPEAPSQLRTSYTPVPLVDGKGGTMLKALLDSAHTIQSCDATVGGWEKFYYSIRDEVNTVDDKKPSK